LRGDEFGKERKRLLEGILAGDVVLAVADDGLPKMLLVYMTTKAKIFARLITSQTKVELDGTASQLSSTPPTAAGSSRCGPCRPRHTAWRLGSIESCGSGLPPDGAILTPAEKQFC
jgi:hypothetical protein